PVYHLLHRTLHADRREDAQSGDGLSRTGGDAAPERILSLDLVALVARLPREPALAADRAVGLPLAQRDAPQGRPGGAVLQHAAGALRPPLLAEPALDARSRHRRRALDPASRGPLGARRGARQGA